MNQIMQKIITLLDQETSLYRELLELVSQERRSLLEGKPAELMELGDAKLGKIKELSDLQAKRRELMLLMDRDGKGEIKLIDLSDYLPEGMRSAYLQAIRRAADIAQKVQNISSTNKMFVEEALDTVNHVMGILTGASQKEETYGQKPTAYAANRPRMFVKEI